MAVAAAAPTGNHVDINTGERFRTKNAKRRAKKKAEKSSVAVKQEDDDGQHQEEEDVKPQDERQQQDSIIDQMEIDTENAAFQAVADVFAKFKQVEEQAQAQQDEAANDDNNNGKGQVIYSDDEDDGEGDEDEDGAPKPLSKRKQRQLQRLTVAELKQLVAKPEMVDGVDITSPDPELLVLLKSTRNTVPVPIHWQQKREYLGNKRGIEKAPYQLPSYIADTGIATIRESLKEKESEQTLKSKTRERVQPKMGKVDIDYQKLHDAFFRFQTPPANMSRYGETYYEGKEYETKLSARRPGELSQELKEALSIPPLAPPPWLIAMQRVGPPPSYPYLRIPGLNAPIPPGAQWGFHPGGWGRAPVDATGAPLYPGVLASQDGGADDPTSDEALRAAGFDPSEVVRERFGELEPEEDDDEDDEEDEDEEEGEGGDGDEEMADQYPAGADTPFGPGQAGLHSVTSTVPGGLETPDFFDIRKDGRSSTVAGLSVESSGPPAANRSLYQVIPERETNIRGLMGSERGYEFAPGSGAPAGAPVLGQEETRRRRGNGSTIDLALDPAELENMSEAELQARYDAARRSALSVPGGAGGSGGEDVALLRAELQRKRAATEARRRGAGGREGDVGKEGRFKF
ncbi:hypothetical protein OC846_005501 [Tilletia horrida]|uniref:PSP proline-rich domain-containing protein n=1 Tax=Tilletia horrida TaxID=155126 RepID=A0AAN6GQH6_9BASI|nr:hypothetical protein OC846_005501 [Tilletia horrida]KAK0551547.1 hypothetical protein OC845_002127 [Tilletia horrida]KAK0569520.1 hypothetical protein OC861_000893 [Tilletia horrida]